MPQVVGEHRKPAIAAKSAFVVDPVTGVDRRVLAGQPIPPDLEDAVPAADGDVERDTAVRSDERAHASRAKKSDGGESKE